MENVRAQEADAFCQELSALTSQQVRLPSEPEWEYAFRAGSTTLFYFGDSLEELTQHGGYRENSEMHSQPVGLMKPKPWDLYDMHSGTDKYCQDPEHPDYQVAPTDQRPWREDGDFARRIKRGGSWYGIGVHCCSAHSSSYPVDVGSEDHGLRVVLEIS